MTHNVRKLAFVLAAAMLLGVGVGKASAQVVVTRYAAPTVTYYYTAPTTSYYVAPTVSYYTPTVSYYTVPTVSYYTPVTTYYATPTVSYYPSGVYRTHYGLFGRPRTTYYYPGYVYP
jgi:hypothetical protein